MRTYCKAQGPLLKLWWPKWEGNPKNEGIETGAWSVGREDPLEKETATHSSILA